MNLEEKFKQIINDPPHAIAGKKGVIDNPGFIEHTQKLLKKYKIIKIKFLKTAVQDSDMDKLSKYVTKLTDSYLLDLRGRTIIISKYPKE